MFRREDFISDREYTEKQVQRQEEAFRILNLGASHKPVYGGEYKAMKESLNLLLEDSLRPLQENLYLHYRDTVTKIREDGTVYKTEPDELIDMYYKHPNLTQMTGFVKFLDKMDSEYDLNPNFMALYKKALEWSMIGHVVKEMKDSVIKGKRPPAVKSEATKMREALDAEKKTCPCCIAKFMVKNDGTMVHHGYKRPGLGFDIGECEGAQRFKPLEVSLDGTYHMVNLCQARKEEYQKAIDELPKQKELTTYMNKFNQKTHKFEKVPYQVTPADKTLWKKTYQNTYSTLMTKINYSNKMIQFYQDVMKNNLNLTYPKDNPNVAEEREKYLKIIHSFSDSAVSSKKKEIAKLSKVSMNR